MPFRTAISGMRAAQTQLETIGHNIANANTIGFKQQRAEFADIYALSQTGIAQNTPGNGVAVAQITQQFGQGNLSVTDNVLDLAIDGEGFFTLDDGGSRVYSRSGAFGLDSEGYIVNAQNQKLITYQTDSNNNLTGAFGPLQLTTKFTSPKATANVELDFNLNSDAAVIGVAGDPIDPANSATYTSSTSTTVYDSLGNPHLANLYFAKRPPAASGNNIWEVQLTLDNTPAGTLQTLEFDTAGSLLAPASGQFNIGPITVAGANDLNLNFDVSNAKQFGSPFAVSKLTQDGYTTGRLSGIDIDSKGVIFARFTNGQSQIQGQVVLAQFQNLQGLQQMGDNAWAETFSSGQALLSAPGSSDLGLVKSGALEDSNVDLTEQLVDMIVAQRNFQANAQVITTADSITQTVINIR